ncbi:MAG: hypothetical protein V3R30_09800 [Kiloniellales bacterium]|jgi:hypothetical protein
MAWGRVSYRLVVLAAAFMATACTSALGPSVPDSLKTADTPEELQLHAKATDGCAFAGTWRYDNEDADGRIDGLFVVQVQDGEIQAMHRFSGQESAITLEHATCPYQSCELCEDGSSCKRGYYVLAYVEPNGRTAAGASLNPKYGTGRVLFILSDDGQGLEVSFQSPGRYLTAHAAKVQGGACNASLPYIDNAARWATRSYPLYLLRLDARGTD